MQRRTSKVKLATSTLNYHDSNAKKYLFKFKILSHKSLKSSGNVDKMYFIIQY